MARLVYSKFLLCCGLFGDYIVRVISTCAWVTLRVINWQVLHVRWRWFFDGDTRSWHHFALSGNLLDSTIGYWRRGNFRTGCQLLSSTVDLLIYIELLSEKHGLIDDHGIILVVLQRMLLIHLSLGSLVMVLLADHRISSRRLRQLLLICSASNAGMVRFTWFICQVLAQVLLVWHLLLWKMIAIMLLDLENLLQVLILHLLFQLLVRLYMA